MMKIYVMKDCKRIKLITEKLNEFLKNSTTENINELNNVIYAGAKKLSDELSIPNYPNRKRETKA